MSAKYLVADVFDGLATLEDNSVDLVVTSPPFLALRSYLPADDPLKTKEIGSEATPSAFLDVMLAFTAELRRVLAPHGSIAIELGDTYAGHDNRGSGEDNGRHDGKTRLVQTGPGWPLAKSKTLIPELYRIALAYGINPLTGLKSPAGQWRIRNVVTWARPDLLVGALGDKWRPATSDVVVACTSGKRYWDDLATRKALSNNTHARSVEPRYDLPSQSRDGNWSTLAQIDSDPASGAPLLDYWEIPLLDGDDEERRYGPKEKPPKVNNDKRMYTDPESRNDGGEGVERYTSQHEGGSPLLDYWVIPPGGYEGSHYAVFPPELVVPLVKAMTPERVCRECGEPSRRIHQAGRGLGEALRQAREAAGLTQKEVAEWFPSATGGVTGCVWNWENETNVPMADQWAVLKDRLAMGDTWDHLLPDRDTFDYVAHGGDVKRQNAEAYAQGTMSQNPSAQAMRRGRATKIVTKTGFTDCGHDNYRPGLVLDPFAGSGTTLLVATGHGHDAIGIDLDQRNAELALQRVGPFLLDLV